MSPSILVVEDDLDFRELLVEHLVASGRSVRCAADGAEALDVLSRAGGAIGLVVLDLRMPIMDGFEVCRRMAEVPTLAGVPVVILTAEHDTRDVTSGGCVVAVLHKPIEVERLDLAVETHLDGLRPQARPPRHAAPTAQRLDGSPG